MLEQKDMMFVPLFSLSFVSSVPIRSTPEFCNFWETFGTQSLLPTLAAICNKILVKMDAIPFFWRVLVTLTWLTFSTPAFKHSLLMFLY